MARTEEDGRRLLDRMAQRLEERFRLRLNAEGRGVFPASAGIEFLGFTWVDGVRQIAGSKMAQKLRKVDELLAAAKTLERLAPSLSETTLGWRNYYKTSDTRQQLQELDQQVGERLVRWLAELRAAHRAPLVAEMRELLLKVELPSTGDPAAKAKWVAQILRKSRPPAVRPAPAATKVAATAHVSPEEAAARRKAQQAAARLDIEELIISREGTSLGRAGERVSVRRDGKKVLEAPLSMVKTINLMTTAVSLSGELMRECAVRRIPIYLYGREGKMVAYAGRLEAPQFELGAAQTAMAKGTAGLELARIFVAGKVQNQMNLLRYFAKYKDRRRSEQFSQQLESSLGVMREVQDSVRERKWGEDLELERSRLFASEGRAAGAYWRAVRLLVWQPVAFEGRIRQGARDTVNSLLNYGYAILYSRLEARLLEAGLQPHIGFLHKPQPNKAGLLYDFIEEFRAFCVDRPVIALLNLGKSYSSTEEGLPEEVRRDFGRAVLRGFQREVRYRGERVAMEKVMVLQARLLARHIRGEEEYRSFVAPW